MGEPLAAAASDNRRMNDRRQKRFSFVLHERRSGFDRREREGASRASVVYQRALLGLRDRPRLVFAVLFVVNTLNLVDFLLTLRVLANGGGEANPILRSLFAVDPLWAGIFKVVAVLLTSWLAWRCRRFRSGLESSLILLAVFAGVICYHIFGLLAYS
jgi:hypothetical protein